MVQARVPSRPPAASAGATWSIAEVERETGIGKDTLRVWERRYGFPVPGRDALGERVYPQAQVDRLRLIKRLLDAGHRPGQVVALTLARLQALAEGGAPGGKAGPGRRAVKGDRATSRATPESAASGQAPAKAQARPGAAALALSDADPVLPWLEWLAQDRTDRVRLALQQHINRQGLGATVDQLVGPLCVQVGEAWMRGELSVYQEHLFTETLQAVLREAIARVDAGGAASQEAPRVLMSTTPTEQHGLGLLMAECHFALESCERFVLGVSTPVADIVLAARQLQVDVLALSFSAFATRRDVNASLQQLADQLPAGVAIWVGGSAPALRGRKLPDRVRVLGQPSDVATQVRAWRQARPAQTITSRRTQRV